MKDFFIYSQVFPTISTRGHFTIEVEVDNRDSESTIHPLFRSKTIKEIVNEEMVRWLDGRDPLSLSFQEGREYLKHRNETFIKLKNGEFEW